MLIQGQAFHHIFCGSFQRALHEIDDLLSITALNLELTLIKRIKWMVYLITGDHNITKHSPFSNQF